MKNKRLKEVIFLLTVIIIPLQVYRNSGPVQHYISQRHHHLQHATATLRGSNATELQTNSEGRTAGLVKWQKTLSQLCYRYAGLFFENICCQMLDYSKNDGRNLQECFVKSPNAALEEERAKRVQKNGSTNSPLPATQTGNTPQQRTPPTPLKTWTRHHWVFIGDSHIRMLYKAFCNLWPESTRVLFRLRELAWIPMSTHGVFMEPTKHADSQQVMFVDALLSMTSYWDPFLKRLPLMIEKWLQQPHLAPSLLVTGGALHFIRKRMEENHTYSADEAADLYEKDLQDLLPKLSALTQYTPVVFQLQDHMTKSPKNVKDRLDDTLDLHNSVARRVLEGSNVSVWDSTIPLSDAYVRECELNPRYTQDRFWFCNNDRHTGNVVEYQSVNMLANYVCNQLVTSDDAYC